MLRQLVHQDATKPKPKRRKASGNPNHREEVTIFGPERVTEAIALLKSGQLEVAIIDANPFQNVLAWKWFGIGMPECTHNIAYQFLKTGLISIIMPTKDYQA